MREGILREHSSLLALVMRCADMLAVGVAGFVAYHARFGTWDMGMVYQLGLVLGIFCAVLFFNGFSLYRAWRGITLFIELRTLAAAWAAIFAVLAAVYTFTGLMDIYDMGWVALWMAMGWLLLATFRIAVRLGLRMLRGAGYNKRTIVLVGMSRRGLDIAGQLRQAAWAGFEVVGYFDERSRHRLDVGDEVPYLGKVEALPDYVKQHHVDQVWLVYPLRAEERVKQTLHLLRHCAVDIRLVLDIYGFQMLNQSINEIAGVPILNLSATPMRGVNAAVKALEDRLLALVILVLISPLMGLIALGVKWSSPGPVFYRQERLSWNGKPFMMLKFRSMPVTAEDSSGPVWAKEGEQRATRFGAFLRRTSLDELPQFINVLKGDMSIVGPRPERPYFVEKFKDAVPDYMKKHLVKAGITGWAQVNGWRGDTDLGKRIEYDLYYIQHWSLWFDLRILAMTLVRGLVHRNAY